MGQFVASEEISVDEQLFVTAVSNSAPADFREKQRPDGSPGTITIRGELIRRLILQIPIRPQGSKEPVVVQIPAARIDLIGVEIDGEIDLNGACGPCGEPLPGLTLEECYIPSTIGLAGANIRSLSLKGSRIVRLSAREATFVNSVNLNEVVSAELPEPASATGQKGQRWVDLRGAKVGGSVMAEKARLVGPSVPDDFKRFSQPAQYALDLTGTVISDSIVLTPDFSAVGGVSIAGALIDNDVRAAGANLKGARNWAFDGNGARIQGSLIMRGYDGVRPRDPQSTGHTGIRQTTAHGGIRLRGAKILGILDLSGAAIEDISPELQDGGVDAQNIEVGGDLVMTSWGREGSAFRTAQGVNLFGAKIAGSLVLAGGKIGTGLIAENIEIGGKAMLGGLLRRTSADGIAKYKTDSLEATYVTFHGASISGDLNMAGVRLVGALNARNISVGGSAYLCGTAPIQPLNSQAANNSHAGCSPAEATSIFQASEVLCDGAKIKGSLILAGATLAGSLKAENLDVGGDAVLSGDFKEGCEDGTRRDIAGYLRATDVILDGTHFTGSLKALGSEISGELTAQNAEIGGDALLGPMDRNHLAIYGDMKLNGAKIAGNLDLSGCRICGGFEARHVQIVGDARLCSKTIGNGDDKYSLEFVSRGLDFTGTKIGGTLEVCRKTDHKEARHRIAQESVAGKPENGLNKIHLSDACVGSLNDNAGEGWGTDALLKMEGFDYGRLIEFESPSSETTLLGRLKLPFFPRGERACKRLRWLELQFRDRKPTLEDYLPGPYERLAGVFRADGYYYEARRIISAKLEIERKIVHPKAYMPLLWLFYRFFDYGLSSLAALGTFLLCITVGSLIVWGALGSEDMPKRVLVIETMPVRMSVVSKKPEAKMPEVWIPAMPKGTDETVQTDEMPCGTRVKPILYALDMFVPALELHQEDKCSFASDAAWYWLLFKAAYPVLGWIVTALTVLTVSGILRRHLEN